MRETLIALIRNTYVSIPPLTYRAVMDDTAAAVIADHLLANGVVVREKGEWEPVKYNAHCSCGKSYGTYHYECQVCHRVFYAQPYGLNFCPICGADMRKGENG